MPRSFSLPSMTRWPLLGLALSVPLIASCRVADPPVMKKNNLGVIYDTKMEAEIRSGKASPLINSAFSEYVDTLSEPVAVLDWSDTDSHWEIFLATNRGAFRERNGRPQPNLLLSEVDFGRAEVHLPHTRRGQDRPNHKKSTSLQFASASSPAEPVDVHADPLTPDDFFDGISRQINRSRHRDLLLFVHGFNVRLEEALHSTSKLGRDLPFNGALVSYCWPTLGGINNYSADEPRNLDSVEPFTDFLIQLRASLDDDVKIHIIVHSMGNRIVMQALNNFPPPESTKPFEHVVLCAPDVGRSDYIAWASGVVAQANHVTLYANQSDSALIASKGLHSEARAGDAWQPLLLPGIETIDCSSVDLTLMGHSYFGNNQDVLSDLFMLIKEGKSADQRPHLKPARDRNGRFWKFAEHAPAFNYVWHFEDRTTR